MLVIGFCLEEDEISWCSGHQLSYCKLTAQCFSYPILCLVSSSQIQRAHDSTTNDWYDFKNKGTER